MRIDLEFQFDRFLLGGDTLQKFQDLLAEQARSWAAGLHVFVEFEVPVPVDIRAHGSLEAAVQLESRRRGELFVTLQKAFETDPQKTLCGTVELRGANTGLGVVVDVNEDIVAGPSGSRRWGNAIAIQVCDSHISGENAIHWSRRTFAMCVALLQPVFAYGALLEEYESKNLVDDMSGTYAVGVDIGAGLPGVYWLNAYGGPYLELFGRNRVSTAPVRWTKDVGNAVLLELAEDGTGWRSADYQKMEAAVRRHLGDEYFFDRTVTDKQLRTIDLSAYL